jgi:hypothetical protein
MRMRQATEARPVTLDEVRQMAIGNRSRSIDDAARGDCRPRAAVGTALRVMLHRDLAAERWALPLAERLGHVGSEISRAEVVVDSFAGPNANGSTGPH